MRRARILSLIFIAVLSFCLVLSGCGKGDSGRSAKKAKGSFKVPPFADAVFNEKEAKGESGVYIDTSATALGYVAVSATSDKRLKFQVQKGEATYNYDMDSQGKPSIFPLQSGSGEYNFRVMENLSESKYIELYAVSCKVKLKDKFQPFLRPSDYVNYRQDSNCVKQAAKMAADASDELDFVSAVYDYICKNISYDKEKARTVQKGYTPSPDETLETGTGICFDYASLAAAMLRSHGIPTVVVFGYVAPDDLYHAWNLFYTKQTGWMAVGFEVKENKWYRIDLTFAANGTDKEFTGDGSNYTDMYYY